MTLQRKFIINSRTLPLAIIIDDCPNLDDSFQMFPCQSSLLFATSWPGPKYILLNNEGLFRI